jgi:hypothetical protein
VKPSHITKIAGKVEEYPLSDQNPSQEQSNSIADEFVELGRNIKQALQSAWTSEERRRLQSEIETGLREASRALKQATDELSKSQAVQDLKADAEDLHRRVQNGELEAKIRSELLSALRRANEELKKAFSGEASPEEESVQPPAGPEES